MSKKVGALDEARTQEIMSKYEGDGKNTIIRHALSRTPILDIAYNSEAKGDIAPQFSIDLKTLPVTNQRMSGRCWIFAGCNLLREIVAKKTGLKNFELSQNYLSLYDKIEKANFALECILELGGRDYDDRELAFILQSPVNDGGQWDMFVNLVSKYGLIPQEKFPETKQSNETHQSDFIVNAAIRGFAAKAAKLLKQGKKDEARALKEETMEKIYTFFLNCFGVPPKTFDFEYEVEKDGKMEYHRDENLTPKAFFDKYIGDGLDEYQSLINSPTADKPFLRNYTIDYLGNVLEGNPINHLNLPMERIKELIIAQLKDGYPVWFGSDVSFYRDREFYAWDSNSFDYNSLFGFGIDFDKADMLDYRNSAMNHAMVITGVNLVDGKAKRWKIENSWGSDRGLSGYYVMSEDFFDRFVYQAVILKRYLNEEEKKAIAQEPIHLHPWDPMGTLAD